MSFGVRALRSILGVTDAAPSAHEPAASKNDDGVAAPGQGLHCRRCGITLVTSIPLRHCPRCGVRQPGQPPDPEEEPVEVIEEKIGRARFAEHPWVRWSWVGWWVGFAAGFFVGHSRADEHRFATLFQARRMATELEVLAIIAGWMLLGGLLGSALGVWYRCLLRPVLLALVSSKRFEREYGWQDKKGPPSGGSAPPPGEQL
jgi:hypothetical protein